MKPKRRLLLIASAAAATIVGLVLWLSLRHEQLYKVTILPSSGVKNIFPSAINDPGQIIVTGKDAVGKTHTFLWDGDSSRQELDLRPISQPNPFGLNNAGQIICFDCDSASQSFLETFFYDFENGKQRPVMLTNDPNDLLLATDINNRGQVVGALDVHAFIWDETTGMRSLGTPEGYFSSCGEAVNDSGQVLGSLVPDANSDEEISCYWHSTDPGSMSTMPLLAPNDFPGGLDINNNGYVLGRKQRSEKAGHWAFLWREDGEIKWLFPFERPRHPYPPILNDPNQVLYSREHRSSLERLSKKYFGPYTQHCLWDPRRGNVVLDDQVPRRLGQLVSVVDINNLGCIVGVIRSADRDEELAVLLEPIAGLWQE